MILVMIALASQRGRLGGLSQDAQAGGIFDGLFNNNDNKGCA